MDQSQWLPKYINFYGEQNTKAKCEPAKLLLPLNEHCFFLRK